MYALVRDDGCEYVEDGQKQVMFEEMTTNERCRTGLKVLLMALLGAAVGGCFVLLKVFFVMDF